MLNISNLECIQLGIVIAKAFPDITPDFYLYFVSPYMGTQLATYKPTSRYLFISEQYDGSQYPGGEVEIHYLKPITSEYNALYLKENNTLYLQQRNHFNA